MKAKEFIKLKKKQAKLEAELENLKDEIYLAQSELMPEMIANGLQFLKTPLGNIRVDRKVWASCDGNVPRAIDALQEAGLDDLVTDTVNASKLAGWVREFDDGMMSAEQITAELPKEVQEAIKVTEKIQLVVTGHKSG